MDRRRFVALSASGLASLWLADAAPAAARPRAATACIVLWLNGGPSHLDTFDPKPGTKEGGPFRAIATRAPGVKLSEHLPRLAERMHEVALLRGMHSNEGNHQRARFLGHTGYAPNPTVAQPGFGARVALALGAGEAELPAFVAIGGPSEGAGFLGAQHGPLVVPVAGAPPANTRLPRRVDEPRANERLRALDALEARFARATGDAEVTSRRAVFARAVRLERASALAAFDLAAEPARDAAAYRDSDFGRGCLLARRLVEAGVKYVEVQLDGWDTHKDNFTRTTSLLGVFDPAIAALLADLEARKRLASTLVVAFGEFGRTPSVNAEEGRDHHPRAFTALLAGGGVRGGVVHGATDERGASVVSGATTVADLFATMATALGLEPGAVEVTRAGRPIALTDHGTPVEAVLR
ncbi:MAG TPA: DUF1501 domain-containing protein [Minicystis sp.]|nr:DUF1501 domain-containing protein [Minicystis sp.]